ncbi:MAG: hypothetical protein K8S20_03155 [Chloroflexi bacterium]|nr:hypothetical protein [Chloroflexota bacterium]
MKINVRQFLLGSFLVLGITLTACMPAGGESSVTINLDDIGGTYYFDGPCFPDTFDLQATLVGDSSRVAAVVYQLTVNGSGGTHLEIINNLFADHTRGGYYSRLVGMAAELSGVPEDVLTGQLSVRALDSSGATLGHSERTLDFQRCLYEDGITIRPDVSTRDLYYGTGCIAEVTQSVVISRFSALAAGVQMTSYWVAEAGGGAADIAAHPMVMSDLSTPASLFFYQFTDTLMITDAVIHDIESFLGPLDLAADPIFILDAIYEFNARENVQRLWNTDRIAIQVHPCAAMPIPTATFTEIPTETPVATLIPYVPPTNKPGGSGGSGGGAVACTDYGKDQGKCEAAGCKWSGTYCYK